MLEKFFNVDAAAVADVCRCISNVTHKVAEETNVDDSN